MSKLQFGVLYRQFLFRMVDLELLSSSAHGDVSKLLGQFAALLVFVGMLFSLGAAGFPGRAPMPQAGWSMEHLLIATNMLVVGLFAVLSWESTFPDRLDVLVLAPLPVRASTLFTAKVAAVASALSLTVLALNALTGLAWPPVLAPAGFLGVARSFAAYWIAMLASGTFVFCSVLTVQGLAALLPRRAFLRASAFLQLAAFCLFVSVYFLEPPNTRVFPSYWFLGLFNTIAGSSTPAFAALSHRALTGLAAALLSAASAFVLSYFRTLRKIIEEPDILPGAHGMRWLPRFGNSLAAAIVQFSIRTLLRSRQHRVMLAFYLGIGFSLVILAMKTPRAQQAQLDGTLFSSLVMMSVWVIGARVVFSMPIALRANWIFRLTEVRAPRDYLIAIRQPVFVLAVAPVWTATAALLLSIWPWRQAVGHLLLLCLWGTVLAYLCLRDFRKIPFTCSYRPGKSYLHMAALAGLGMLFLIGTVVKIESAALVDPARYAILLAVFLIAALCARWFATANIGEAAVQFEDLQPPAVQALGLTRDGVMPLPARLPE